MHPQLFLIAFLLLRAVTCSKILMCDSDSDCQDGFSCIENICKICVKCALIFRKSNNCASDFNDCGDCLEGYKEISVTDNTAVKKPCRPIKKKMNLNKCATDNHCPPNNFCSEKSCVNCFDCSLINKITPEKCARDPNECGPCFIGYLSIHDRSRTNYNKCEKVFPDREPYNIHTGSVYFAFPVALVAGVTVLFIIHKKYTGEAAETSTSTKISTIEVPGKVIILLANQTQANNAQSQETISSPGTVICLGDASLSEVNSINSHSDSQNEQPDDVYGLNNDSAENNSHLEDPAEVPENQAKESTEELSLGK